MPSLADAIGGIKRIVGGPFGSKLTQADYAEVGVPVIRGGNMERDGRWIGGNFVYVSHEKTATDLVTNLAEAGDIIVTQRGTLGQVSIVPFNSQHSRFVISQSQMAIKVDRRVADVNFVYYYLKSSLFLAYIERATIQTGVPHINLGVLRDAPVDWPPISNQREIAAVLATLDDKINLNRRMNETLEAMARAIFKDWFVDFGPTRAKMEGREPYLSPEIWALFPDRLDDDGKPEGWLLSNIGQETHVVGGSTPSISEPRFWDGEFPWVTPKDMSQLSAPVLLQTDRKITQEGLKQIGSGLLPVGTVLLSSRAPIGYLAISDIPVAINQGFIAMICNGKLSNIFSWLWVAANTEAILARANGSTFLEISKSNFRPIPVVFGADELLKSFDRAVGPLWLKIRANERERRELTETRDLLLPKLMSGEIRIRDVMKIVGTAL